MSRSTRIEPAMAALDAPTAVRAVKATAAARSFGENRMVISPWDEVKADLGWT